MNYYEIEVPFTRRAQPAVGLGERRPERSHESQDRRIDAHDVVTKQIRDAVDPSRVYKATLRGNPTLFNVRFLYVGLRNRTDRTIDRGEVWFDDIRLGGVRRDIDHAENVRFSADFAGILQLSANWTRTGPEFRSLRQSRGSGTTNSGLSFTAKTEINYLHADGAFQSPRQLPVQLDEHAARST